MLFFPLAPYPKIAIPHLMHLIRYKKDLRIRDHHPLTDALSRSQKTKQPCAALYIREPSVMSHGDFSAFHHYWIQESLIDLSKNLATRNIPLLIRYGEVIDILTHINNTIPITSLHAHEETGNGLTFARDTAVIRRTKHHTIPFQETPTNGVVRRLRSRDERASIWDQRIVKTHIISPPSAQLSQ